LQTLLGLVEERQQSLRQRAWQLGARIYAERPRDFVRRLRGYWRAWQRENHAGGQAGAAKPGRSKPMEPEMIADYPCHTGESPLWHPGERRVYWVDIPAGRIYRCDPATGQSELCRAGEAVGGLTLQEDGTLLLFMARGAIAGWRQGRLEYLIEEIEAERESRFNDVIADPAGRVFCGTMPGPAGPGRLYRLDTNRSLRQLLDGIGCSNGMGFTPDRRHMYYTDSARKAIYRFDYDPASGALANQRVFIDSSDQEGVPDGMTVDAEGCLWSARWDGGCLIRYTPEGIEERRIRFPARKVSSVVFGGEDYTDIFVTTAGGGQRDAEGPGAGALFRINLGIKGVPEFCSRVE
jgi:D-xylono/L-arabinono-1,4-lactonase